MTKCNKKKFDKIGAMLALAKANKLASGGNFNRREHRIYYCEHCKAWHLTSH